MQKYTVPVGNTDSSFLFQVYLVKKSWNEAEATSTKRDKNNYWGRPYLGLDNSDAERYPQSGAVTIFPYRPRGFVEFDITRAVRSWSNRVPNHGLLILATNELAAGRGIRFSSNAGPLAWRAHVLVLCRYWDTTMVFRAPQRGVMSSYKSQSVVVRDVIQIINKPR